MLIPLRPFITYFPLRYSRLRSVLSDFTLVKVFLSSSASRSPIDKVLIANRGEIACRIIKTCRSMGIQTVAIYSSIDSQSMHVRMADESWCVGSPVSASSYLNMDSILAAALATGSQAVHPGYGFLSENFEFVDLLEKHGIVFIGPCSKAMRIMGDKVESKLLASNAKVNTIPGFLGVISDECHALNIARDIGYPVMIKASAGGGGKGMRITNDCQQLKQNFLLATNEAQNSFGDSRLLIEKYLPNSRHIEIQILCDKFGNTISLNERECSIQRRNQKVIEEAPSTYTDDNLRTLMSNQAKSLANAVNYVSAGTIEFLVDESRRFYFLEMNTRIQVEHPITEFITGFDIVKEMIHIAMGDRLSISQEEVPLLGWSIESRVYAEDPLTFLPSIGRITQQIIPPMDNQYLRVDTGVSTGTEVSIHYDPLLLKLVSFGKSREDAISNMVFALDNYVISGVKTNIPFIYSVLTNFQFLAGNTDTNFIQKEYPGGFKYIKLSDKDQKVLDICASLIYIVRNSTYNAYYQSNIFPYEERPTKWKLYCFNEQNMGFNVIEYISDLRYIVRDYDGASIDVQISWIFPDVLIDLQVGLDKYTLQFLNRAHAIIQIGFRGGYHDCFIKTHSQYTSSQYIKTKHLDTNPFALFAPMSGRISDILVNIGDKVSQGTSLVIIEAMKMHNVLISQNSTRVRSINVQVGDNVGDGDCLLEFSE